MYHKPSRKKELIKRIAIYFCMTATVVLTVTFVTMYMLGYRFNVDNKDIEQNSFLQFSSSPSGATVTVDGAVIGSKTPNKTSTAAGEHKVVMWKSGYETWQKTVTTKAGVLTWLDYALLVPKDLTVESMSKYSSVYSSVATPNGNKIIIQKVPNIPDFELVDLSSDTISKTTLTIPSSVYSDANTSGISHAFQIQNWDEDGRYLLIKHTYGDSFEWLVMDTKNADSAKNITKLFDISISSIAFSDTDGEKYYVLVSGDLRKLDLNNQTISAPLVGKVTSFSTYNEKSVVAYTGISETDAKKQIIGIYSDGDSGGSVIKTINNTTDLLKVATTRYFNENYIAISDGKKVEILSGSYPSINSDNTNSLKTIETFETTDDIQSLSFSPSGEYVFVRFESGYDCYDLEYQNLSTTIIDGSETNFSLVWLDDNHLWSDRDGKLVIVEFDGENRHTINSVVTGQGVTLTHNGRYIYSINKVNSEYQLQRVRMILS